MGERPTLCTVESSDGRRLHRRFRYQIPLQLLAPGHCHPSRRRQRMAELPSDAAGTGLPLDSYGGRGCCGYGDGPVFQHRLHQFLDDQRGPYPGITRKFWSFSEAARENGASRILCGIHFSTAVNAGYVQGERIGEWAFENALRPAKPQQAITATSVSEKRSTEARATGHWRVTSGSGRLPIKSRLQLEMELQRFWIYQRSESGFSRNDRHPQGSTSRHSLSAFILFS